MVYSVVNLKNSDNKQIFKIPGLGTKQCLGNGRLQILRHQYINSYYYVSSRKLIFTVHYSLHIYFTFYIDCTDFLSHLSAYKCNRSLSQKLDLQLEVTSIREVVHTVLVANDDILLAHIPTRGL